VADADKNARHANRMVRKKAVIDANIAAANTARGLLIINTGNGKGKSSAAFGLLARALGHGMKCAVIQFVKGRSDTGEEAFFRDHPDVTWHVMGEGFTWETQDASRDAAVGQAAWKQACRHLHDENIQLVILDEFTYALKYRWLNLDDVLANLADRPSMQHVVITGRAAPPELIAVADTVTEMQPIKHAFQAGVQAMPGIEW
jgi:cob(I)alamin adenosyltransferase